MEAQFRGCDAGNNCRSAEASASLRGRDRWGRGDRTHSEALPKEASNTTHNSAGAIMLLRNVLFFAQRFKSAVTARWRVSDRAASVAAARKRTALETIRIEALGHRALGIWGSRIPDAPLRQFRCAAGTPGCVLACALDAVVAILGR